MFQQALEFGKGYKPPSFEALRTTILQRSKERLTNKLAHIKEIWKHIGCTIIDMNHRPPINVLVSSPEGVLFVKAFDAMDHKKTSEFIFKILEKVVLEVGEENVVQIVTDSALNYVGVGKMIMARFKIIYWTPCAAHCMDLLLHDLGKLPWVNEAIRRGKLIVNFVGNHRLTLSIYRKHATRELLRPCDTRFATYYITLNRVVEAKASLRLIICSNEWEKSPLSKTSKGKLMEEIILISNFWDSAQRVLNMCESIVEMLHLVDSDTPCMGYVYEGMEHCKEVIARVFNNVIDDYKLVWMVDFRWKMMHSPLHAAACYLDPRSFGFKRNGDKEIMSGLYESIGKLHPNRELAKKVREQLRAYKLQ
eukprot:Gb_25432 [translate_table: standard]